MNCTEFENLSMLYFDGDASAQQVTELHEHIDICSSCRVSFESMKETIEMLEAQEEFDIGENFTREVMSKVRDYEESRIRTSALIEKMAFPLIAVIICMGSLTWYLILNNIHIGFVLYRLINLAVLLLDTVASLILYSRILDYFKFMNSQLQVILPITLIFIGIMIYFGKNIENDHENA